MSHPCTELDSGKKGIQWFPEPRVHLSLSWLIWYKAKVDSKGQRFAQSTALHLLSRALDCNKGGGSSSRSFSSEREGAASDWLVPTLYRLYSCSWAGSVETTWSSIGTDVHYFDCAAYATVWCQLKKVKNFMFGSSFGLINSTECSIAEKTSVISESKCNEA